MAEISKITLIKRDDDGNDTPVTYDIKDRTARQMAEDAETVTKAYADEKDAEIKQTVQNLDKRIFNNKNLLQTEWTGTIEASDEEISEYIVLDAISYPIDTQVTLSIYQSLAGGWQETSDGNLTQVLADLLKITFTYSDGTTGGAIVKTYTYSTFPAGDGSFARDDGSVFFAVSKYNKTVSKISIDKLAWAEPIALTIEKMQLEVTPKAGSGYYTDYEKYESPTFATPKYVNAYADEKDSETLGAAKAYADEKDAETLLAAKEHSDKRCSDVLGVVPGMIEETAGNTLYSANAYTDNKNADLKDYSNNNFANAFIGKKSGSAVRIDDASPVEHNSKVAVRSKNIIPSPYEFTEQTKNECTMVVNENGSVTVSGTPTADATFRLKRFDGLLYAGKTLTVAATTGVLRMYVHVQNQAGEWTFNFIRSDKANNTAIIPEGTTMLEVGVVASLSFDGMETIFYPQIEIGDTATEYTPYVEDLSSVNVMGYGKNLFPMRLFGDPGNNQPSYYTYDATSHTLTMVKDCSTSSCGVYVRVPGTLVIGKKYSISLDVRGTAGKRVFVGFSGKPVSVTLTKEYQRVSGSYTAKRVDEGVVFYTKTDENGEGLAAGEWLQFDNIQIETGDSATDYESYIEPVTYTPVAGGGVRDVLNINPAMTLLTDTPGVIIDCTYNRDANKVYEQLVNAIISLGGNV